VDVRSDTALARPRNVTNQIGRLSTNAVAQASGIVSVQANCSVNHAVVLMVTRAQETNATLEQIAISVIDQLTRFDA
jgi:hypothetical protein